MKLPITQEHINAIQSTGDISKESLANAAAVAVADLGELSAKEKLTLLTEITAIETYADEIKKLLKKDLKGSDVELTGSVHGAKIVFCATSTKYDYTNDEVWKNMNLSKTARESTLKTQLSLYEKHLAAGNKAVDFIGIVNPDGVQIPLITKEQSNGVKITLGK